MAATGVCLRHRLLLQIRPDHVHLPARVSVPNESTWTEQNTLGFPGHWVAQSSAPSVYIRSSSCFPS